MPEQADTVVILKGYSMWHKKAIKICMKKGKFGSFEKDSQTCYLKAIHQLVQLRRAICRNIFQNIIATWVAYITILKT